MLFTSLAGADDREALEGAKLDATLADITKARKDVKSLRAQFTQERRIALLSTTVKSTGELTTVPDRLRWDLAPPDDIVYFIGPEGLSYKTKSSSATVPANTTNIARGLADLRALLNGDLATLKERYELKGSKTAADVEIQGTAKDKSAPIRGFTLLLDKGFVIPLRAKLLEGKNDSITIAFSNAVVNGPVDATKMKP